MSSGDDDKTRIAQRLADLPELAAQLPDMITQRRTQQNSTPTPASRPPLRLDIVALLDQRDRTAWANGMQLCDPTTVGLLPYLWGWARDIESTALDNDVTLPAGDTPTKPTITTVCAWLTASLDYAHLLPEWPELAAGIEHCWRTTRAAVGGDDKPKPVPCPHCRAGRLQRLGETATWECNQCGRAIATQPVTLQQAVKETGIPLSTLYRWTKHKLIVAVQNHNGQRLWDLGDIRRQAAATRLKPTQTKRKEAKQ